MVFSTYLRVGSSAAAASCLAGEETASNKGSTDPSPIVMSTPSTSRGKNAGIWEWHWRHRQTISSTGARCGEVAKEPAIFMWVD